MSDRASELILLDTHVWVWGVQGDAKLGNSKTMMLIQEGIRASSVRVAAISMWEVAMLESKGRLGFGVPCTQWLRTATRWPGISVEPLSMEVAAESGKLPGSFHGDPADRLIVATARILGCRLITADQRILDYGREGHLSVIPV